MTYRNTEEVEEEEKEEHKEVEEEEEEEEEPTLSQEESPRMAPFSITFCLSGWRRVRVRQMVKGSESLGFIKTTPCKL